MTWGTSLHIDLKNCRRELIDEDNINHWIVHLCDFIGAIPHIPPFVICYGNTEKNTDFSVVQFIELSHITARFSTWTAEIFIDILLDRKFDTDSTVEMCAAYFDAEITNYKKLERGRSR